MKNLKTVTIMVMALDLLVSCASQSPKLSFKEDCIPFKMSQLKLLQKGKDWFLYEFEKGTEHNHVILHFPNKEEGDHALEVIKKHKFSKTCYIGRPKPSMTYWK